MKVSLKQQKYFPVPLIPHIIYHLQTHRIAPCNLGADRKREKRTVHINLQKVLIWITKEAPKEQIERQRLKNKDTLTLIQASCQQSDGEYEEPQGQTPENPLGSTNDQSLDRDKMVIQKIYQKSTIQLEIPRGWINHYNRRVSVPQVSLILLIKHYKQHQKKKSTSSQKHDIINVWNTQNPNLEQ